MKRILFIAFFFFMSASTWAQRTDELFKRYRNSESAMLVTNANKVFAELYKNGYSDTLRKFSTHSGKPYIDAYVYEAMSQWYLDNGNYHESIQLATEAATLCKRLKDLLYTSNCYATLCIAYLRIGDMKRSIAYGKSCYHYDLVSKDAGNISSSLSNLAGLYLTDNHPKAAESYILKAIEIEKTLHRNKFLAIRYGIASEIYTALKQFDKAIEYADMAYQLDIQGHDEQKAGIRLAQLAAAYNAKGDLKMAERNYLKAIKLLEKYDVKCSLAITYNQIGELYAKAGNKGEATAYLQKSFIMSKAIDNKMQALKSCTILANLVEKDSPSDAVCYWKTVDTLRQSIYRTESENQINRFNIEYETKEKENKIVLQEAEIARNETHRLHLLFGLICCLVVIAFTVLVIRHQRKRNLYLKELNSLKDRFDSLMAHDLKNPVVAQKGTLDIIVEHFDSLSKEDLHTQCINLKESATSLQELLYNLLSWSQLEGGRIPYHPTIFPLVDVVREVTTLYATNFQKKQITPIQDIPLDAVVKADRNMISTVVRNLVNNALKYSYRGHSIRITANDACDYWQLSVEDEGTGISDEKLRNLFRIDVRHSVKGTEGENGTGLGLAICREMIKKHGGDLRIERKENGGTTFSFDIPKANN